MRGIYSVVQELIRATGRQLGLSPEVGMSHPCLSCCVSLI